MITSKSCYEKWKVNEPGVFYILFYIQSRGKRQTKQNKKKKKKNNKKNKKKTVAGVARKKSKSKENYRQYSMTTWSRG